METSRKSTMKTWEAKPVKRGKRQLIGIICPTCGGRALVSKKWLDVSPREEAIKTAHSRGDFKGRVFRTRPCTYCFISAWLPGFHPDENDA
jgi:hypothetical protein